MHVQTIGAAVDLRAAQTNEISQSVLKSAFLKILCHAEQGFESSRSSFDVVKTRFHKLSFELLDHFYRLDDWCRRWRRRFAARRDCPDVYPIARGSVPEPVAKLVFQNRLRLGCV
jgi:hypothetical protein